MNASLPNVLTDGTLKYVYGLSLAYAVDGSGNVQVYHTDGLGSVQAITNASGNLIQTYQTDPFGVPTQTQGSSAQPFQFTVQQRGGNGLIYLRARYYDPAIGRFLSRDRRAGALHQSISLDRYIYAGDNPTSDVDPSGLTPQHPDAPPGPMSPDQSPFEAPRPSFCVRVGPIEVCVPPFDARRRPRPRGGKGTHTPTDVEECDAACDEELGKCLDDARKQGIPLSTSGCFGGHAECLANGGLFHNPGWREGGGYKRVWPQ